MKKLLCIYLTLIMTALNGFCQSKDEQSVLNVLTAQSAAWNKGDIEGFMAGYWKSDSLKFIGKSGISYGWQTTLEHYKKGYPDTASMGKLTFEVLDIKRLSALYFSVVGKWSLKRSIGDVSGYFTLIWRKVKNRWVIVQDHSS